MTETTHKGRGGNEPPFAIAPAIALDGITKVFGTTTANDAIDLTVEAGRIHGIVGENGAGKSTLVSILYGFYQADSGSIRMGGEVVRIKSAADAIAMGIGMVHQHFMLVPNFTVLDNIILGFDGSSAGGSAGGADGKSGAKSLAEARDTARAKLTDLAAQYGFRLDFDAVVSSLSVGVQQRVEILKALYRGAEILILDEPTGVLTPQETDQLFEILKSLRSEGVTILLITHKLREIMAITDDVSVMRGGKMVAHLKTAKTNPEQLAELMVGRKVLIAINANAISGNSASGGSVMLKAENVSLEGASGKNLLDGLDFELRAGEILAVAGVSGNGQTELLDVLSGIRPISAGRITIDGHHITPQAAASAQEIKNLGVAHVPEDRHAMGIVLPFTAAESAILGHEGAGFWIDPESLNNHCGKLMDDYDIRPQDPSLKSHFFSGGNQQKLVLARELSAAPKILLVGQPTRGVDIGAIEFIYNQLIEMRDKGCAILLVSVELDEIFTLADRIIVMNGGASMGIVNRAETTPQAIGLMMAGVEG